MTGVGGSLTRARPKDVALIEIAHWYENVMLLGWIFLFFSIHWAVGLAFTAAAYFLMLLLVPAGLYRASEDRTTVEVFA